MKPEYHKVVRGNKQRVVIYLDPLIAEIIEAYAKEHSWTTTEYISEVLNRHIRGREISKKPRKNPEVDNVIKEYKQGQYTQAILDRYHLTITQLRTILRVNKVPPRAGRVTIKSATEKGLL